MAINSTGEPVSYEEAVKRLLAKLPASGSSSPWRPSSCADVIWPGHKMTRQGAALAAGKILSRARKDGVLRWKDHGWVRA